MESRKLTKQQIILIALGVVAVLACIAAALLLHVRNNGDIDIKGTEYLAGGTIPADAKVYPIMAEDMPMIVSGNSDGTLSAEDIWTITHYVDLFVSLDDKAGASYDPEKVTFLTTRTLDEVLRNNENAGDNYAVKSAQILAIDVEEENRVQVAYVEQLTGSSNEVSKGDYIAVAGLFFKRVNGNWYEDGIGHYVFEKDGVISIDVDNLTGAITVNYT